MKGKIKYIPLILAAFFLTCCANVVAPTGGAKDVTPPKVTEAVPANHSTGFDGEKIELTFDEYVGLNNANQNVLFSPLLTTKPDIKLSGKTVVIKFKEELAANTTYTIYFGEAIKDFHEGNLFKDYVYSFSTGDHLDTLTLAGKVLNADDEKPASDLFVTLYESQRDSLFDLPRRHVPDFITKTDKDGNFIFHGLPDKSFLVFALNDMNSNYYYDLPNETVAFLDTVVSTKHDSINTTNQKLTLYAFKAADTTQMLLEKKLIDEGLLHFVFRQPAKDANIVATSKLDDSFQLIQVWSKDHDTLCWHFTPGVMDSLRVNIQYDTVNESTVFNLKYKDTKPSRGRVSKALKVANNLRNKLLMPGEDFQLQFSEPVIDLKLPDSVHFERVDEYGMVYRVEPFGNDSTGYSLNLSDSVFFSIRGRTNDSISIMFKRAKEADLGNIFITVVPPENTQVVVQLLNSKKAVLEQQVIDTVTRLAFRQLLPEKYQLKAIIDDDKNGRWSSGDFHKRFLPEKCLEFKELLEVKSGWDIDLDEPWELKK
jgi:hypothetical protein